MTSADPHPLVYTGRSMAGTFRAGDLLFWEPTPVDRVRVGDVVVFRRPEDVTTGRLVVHRVVGKGTHGLKVQGDANRDPDEEVVTGSHLVGLVTHYVRRANRVSLPGDRLLRHGVPRVGWWRRLERSAGPWIRSAARGPYHRLRSSHLFCVKRRPSLRKVRFSNGKGEIVKYLIANRTVAWNRPGEKRTSFRKPFDLLFRGDVEDGSPE